MGKSNRKIFLNDSKNQSERFFSGALQLRDQNSDTVVSFYSQFQFYNIDNQRRRAQIMGKSKRFRRFALDHK